MMRLLKHFARLVAGALAIGALAVLRLLRPARKASVKPPGGERQERFRWKQRLRTMAAFLAVLAVGGFLVAALGLVPIKASSGHWALTRWFLSFSMSRSVSTYSLGIDAPPLDSLASRALVLKGAGHYETGCQPCHGSPALRHPVVAQQMTPAPPYLPPEISKWDPAELFYIVKHGVKFTGMPAWPAQQRDDEVWAMVAFLRAFPDLDAAAYRQLVRVDDAEPEAPLPERLEIEEPLALGATAQMATARCARCHGRAGRGRGAGAFPLLAGQRPTYLYNSLRAYADGERHSGMMKPVAAGLSDKEMRALARYFGAQEEPALQAAPAVPAPPTASAAIERGAAIAREGIPSEGIPSCVDCHGPGRAPRNPAYPVLAGQYARYLALQLRLFRKEHRGGSVYARLMHPTAHRLTPEQVHAVSLYYESLRAAPSRPTP